MENSLPPDIVARVLDLERRMNNQERQQNPVQPTIFQLSDVSGQATADGMVLQYDRTSGTWQPSVDWAPGDVKWTASNVAPAGRWLAADGSAVSRTTYAQLFAEIGTVYGAGDGSTTFNLPNLSSRMPIGVGTDALGATGGARTHTLTQNETTMRQTNTEAAGYGLPPNDQDVAFENRVIVGGLSATAHNNMPPYIALYSYIRY